MSDKFEELLLNVKEGLKNGKMDQDKAVESLIQVAQHLKDLKQYSKIKGTISTSPNEWKISLDGTINGEFKYIFNFVRQVKGQKNSIISFLDYDMSEEHPNNELNSEIPKLNNETPAQKFANYQKNLFAKNLTRKIESIKDRASFTVSDDTLIIHNIPVCNTRSLNTDNVNDNSIFDIFDAVRCNTRSLNPDNVTDNSIFDVFDAVRCNTRSLNTENVTENSIFDIFDETVDRFKKFNMNLDLYLLKGHKLSVPKDDISINQMVTSAMERLEDSYL